MLKKLLRKLIFPTVLVAVLGLLALYIVISGDSRKATVGNYTPERASAYFGQLTFEQGNPAGETMQAGGKTWYRVAERETSSLWLEPGTGQIAVKGRDGHLWFSNPSEAELAADKTQGLWKSNLSSPFLFRYLKEKETMPSLSNTVDQKTTVAWRSIQDGVGVKYTIEELGFTFYFEYSLNEDGFQANLPELGIAETKTNRLVTVEALPFFGAAPAGSDGYLLVPDGPGGLIQFNKPRSGLISAYDFPVYGEDEAIPTGTPFFPRDNIAFPVYGMKHGDGGFVAVIEQGEFKANIYASPSGVNTGFSAVFAKFNLRRPYLQPTGLKKTVDTYESKLIVEPVQIRYMLLGREESDYVGMAKTYRQYLQKHAGAAKMKETSGKPPLFLDFIMAATEPTPVADKMVVATTFAQAGVIAGKLSEQGIERLELGFGGWNPGGFQGSLPKRFPIEEAVGGLRGLTDLSAQLKKKEIGIHLQDVYTQATNKLGNGFSPLSDAARLIDGTALKLMNAGDWYSEDTYFYRPRAAEMKINLEEALERFRTMPIDGIGLVELGSVVNSDFSSDEPYDRKMTAGVYRQMLDEAHQTAGTVMTSGANAYVLGHVDHIQDFPSVYNYDLIIDEQVPFYPIAVHGLVTYSAKAGNNRIDPVNEYLRAIEYGAQPYFVVTDADPRVLKRTNYASLFSSQFSVLEPGIVKEYDAFARASEGVWGSFIDNHRSVAKGVYETTYENGRKIWVNYNMDPYSEGGHTVDAQSFAVIEQGGTT